MVGFLIVSISVEFLTNIFHPCTHTQSGWPLHTLIIQITGVSNDALALVSSKAAFLDVVGAPWKHTEQMPSASPLFPSSWLWELASANQLCTARHFLCHTHAHAHTHPPCDSDEHTCSTDKWDKSATLDSTMKVSYSDVKCTNLSMLDKFLWIQLLPPLLDIP